jgi:hypothetical protein
MIKDPGGVRPKPLAPAEGPSPEAKGDGRKALILLFGAITLIHALKFLLRY